MLTAYLLSASICTPLLGRLGDALGKKRVLVVTLGALSLGSLVLPSAVASFLMGFLTARLV